MRTVAGRAASADSGLVDKILGNPLVGLSPWIVYSLVEGFADLEVSAAVAFGNALALLLIGWVRGSHPKLLEYSGVTFFGALAIFIAFASDSTHDWLELWGGEVANVALVVVALGSIPIRDPFTLAYAKESTPESLWDNPKFPPDELHPHLGLGDRVRDRGAIRPDRRPGARGLEQHLDRLDRADAAADLGRPVHPLVSAADQGGGGRGGRPADLRVPLPGDAVDRDQRSDRAVRRRHARVDLNCADRRRSRRGPRAHRFRPRGLTGGGQASGRKSGIRTHITKAGLPRVPERLSLMLRASFQDFERELVSCVAEADDSQQVEVPNSGIAALPLHGFRERLDDSEPSQGIQLAIERLTAYPRAFSKNFLRHRPVAKHVDDLVRQVSRNEAEKCSRLALHLILST